MLLELYSESCDVTKPVLMFSKFLGKDSSLCVRDFLLTNLLLLMVGVDTCFWALFLNQFDFFWAFCFALPLLLNEPMYSGIYAGLDFSRVLLLTFCS